jgi:hypothetical protein
MKIAVPKIARPIAPTTSPGLIVVVRFAGRPCASPGVTKLPFSSYRRRLPRPSSTSQWGTGASSSKLAEGWPPPFPFRGFVGPHLPPRESPGSGFHFQSEPGIPGTGTGGFGPGGSTFFGLRFGSLCVFSSAVSSAVRPVGSTYRVGLFLRMRTCSSSAAAADASPCPDQPTRTSPSSPCNTARACNRDSRCFAWPCRCCSRVRGR